MLASLRKQLMQVEKRVGVFEDCPPVLIEGYIEAGQYGLLSAMWQHHGRWNFWHCHSGEEYPPELKALLELEMQDESGGLDRGAAPGLE